MDQRTCLRIPIDIDQSLDRPLPYASSIAI